MKNPTPLLALALGGALLTGTALAQAVPPAADAANASERFRERSAAHDTSNPLSMEGAPEVEGALKDQRFLLGGIKITGLSALPESDLRPFYADRIGKQISVGELQDIATRITDRYHEAGYALAIAYVPDQSVDDGDTVTIRVDEGRVGTVQFMGEHPTETTHATLMSIVRKIQSLRPVTTDALERTLLLINDLPGNVARAVLRPSATDLGATDLFIYFTSKPAEFTASTDNRGSSYLGPWQHSTSVSIHSILGMDERINLRGVVTSPLSEMRYIDFTYEQPVGVEGTKIAVTISHARTKPGHTLKSQNVKGLASELQLRATHPFLRSRLQNLSARITLDGRNAETDVSFAKQSYDRVRSVRLGASYDRADDLNGSTLVDAELSHGVEAGATDDGTGRTRSSGEHDYSKATLDLIRLQNLPADFSLLLSSSGQYAFDPLLSSEQYILGGPAYGAAYDPGELAGDHALAGKIELRYGQRLGDPLIDFYQLYGYYDIGRVWRKAPLGGEKDTDSLASAGVGVRTDFNAHISGLFELAFPLTRNPGAHPHNDARIYGGMSVRY